MSVLISGEDPDPMIFGQPDPVLFTGSGSYLKQRIYLIYLYIFFIFYAYQIYIFLIFYAYQIYIFFFHFELKSDPDPIFVADSGGKFPDPIHWS